MFSHHNSSSQDNRKSSRYPVRDSSAVMLMSENIISYTVLDISNFGLSFCYNDKPHKVKMSKKTTMTFFADNSGSTDIPIQIINDTELNPNYLPFLSDADRSKMPYLRRCGVEFTQLSSHQKEMINNYIKHLPADMLPGRI